MQIGKLYSYYFRKIWRKNWLRVVSVTLFQWIWWFLIPFLLFFYLRNQIKVTDNDRTPLPPGEHNREERSGDFEEISYYFNRFLTKNEQEETIRNYQGFARFFFSSEKWGEYVRLAKKGLERLKAEGDKLRKKGNLTKQEEERLSLINKWTSKIHYFLKGDYFGLFSLPYLHSDLTTFFTNRPENWSQDFFELLHRISFWALFSFTTLFFLFIPILNYLFVESKENGEDSLVLTLTSPSQRSDLITSKILAFLTYFFIYSFLSFALPFGIYCGLVGGENFSWGAFSLLIFYSTFLAPLLIFSFPLLFYLLAFSWKKWLGIIISTAIAWWPLIWMGLRWFFLPNFSLFHNLEKWWFDPTIYAIFILSCGFICLIVYYWKYQKEDLG